MKKVSISILAVFLMAFTVTVDKLSEAERAFANEELTKSMKMVHQTIQGLSDAQLNFKPSSESWSIAECMEHIALSENNIFEMVNTALASPSDPHKETLGLEDEQVIAMMKDRSNKVKTFKPFEPSGKFGSFQGSVDAFNKLRKAHIEYVLNTDDDLRKHYAELPFGTLDSYQVILFMSGHTQRHVLQMQEVMEHEKFPKK